MGDGKKSAEWDEKERFLVCRVIYAVYVCTCRCLDV